MSLAKTKLELSRFPTFVFNPFGTPEPLSILIPCKWSPEKRVSSCKCIKGVLVGERVDYQHLTLGYPSAKRSYFGHNGVGCVHGYLRRIKNTGFAALSRPFLRGVDRLVKILP